MFWFLVPHLFCHGFSTNIVEEAVPHHQAALHTTVAVQMLPDFTSTHVTVILVCKVFASGYSPKPSTYGGFLTSRCVSCESPHKYGPCKFTPSVWCVWCVWCICLFLADLWRLSPLASTNNLLHQTTEQWKVLFFSCLGYLALCLCLPDSSRKTSLGIYCISWFSKTHPGPQLRMKSFASHAYKHASVHIDPFMQATSGNHSLSARENIGNNKRGQIHAKIGRLGLGYLSSTEMSCPTCGDCRSAYSSCNHLIYFVPWCFVWFCGWTLLRGSTPGPGGPSPQAPSNRSATGRRAACAPESASTSRNQGHAARYMWRQGWNKKNTKDM